MLFSPLQDLLQLYLAFQQYNSTAVFTKILDITSRSFVYILGSRGWKLVFQGQCNAWSLRYTKITTKITAENLC